MHPSLRVIAPILMLTSALPVIERATSQDSVDADQLVQPAPVVEQMGWLSGAWSGEMWGGEFHAYYSTPEGGKIISHSKLVKGENEAFYEFELFETRGSAVHLQPFPGGKKVDGFLLESLDPKARKAVFENPDKDYPTRIVYQRVSDDELVITLSDPHGGSEKIERFELSR